MAAETYLALGDSMSIDLYTDVVGGGAVAQFHRSLGPGWNLEDHTFDGCVIEQVPTDRQGALITMTIGGNNLYFFQDRWLEEGLAAFKKAHRGLLATIRKHNPSSTFIVGNVYAPQFALDPPRLALLEEANAAIAEHVAAIGGRLADLRATFRGHEDDYLTKLIEPSLRGATAIAALFAGARLR